MSDAIIGREEELAAIEAFLGAVEQGPRALVLSGEAGIGKTVLWEAGVDDARERYGRVLTCRGVEAEASLSFAGLSELLGDVLEEVGSLLAPPRRRALEVALLLAEPGETTLDPHAIGLAVLDALRALAEQGPVLVALDDVQWVDTASAGAIQIAFRRLREEPLGLLATLRLGPELESPFELERSLPHERFRRLTLDPLSLAALHRLLEERLGLELTRPELSRVQEATAGNPFFALELGRELVRTNTRPTPGQALRVPDSLRELLGGRLARLPGEILDVLLLVAALARPTVELLATTYGERERVLEALETAVEESVVELDDSSVRFAHPLLASICYERAPVWKRRAVHAALAGALSDVEERARHLALAADGPDAVAAEALDAAADSAASRGATAAAAELAVLAARLTPGDPALDRGRRFRAAGLYRLAGDTERAVAILEQLLTEVPHGPERSDFLFELAVTQTRGSPAQLEILQEALDEAAGDARRSALILSMRAGTNLVSANARAALVDARAALEQAEVAGDPTALAWAIGYVGQAENYLGQATPGLLERGVEIEDAVGHGPGWMASPRYALARRLMRLGDVDLARGLLEQVEAAAVERGDEVTRVMVLWPLATIEWIAGRWQQALDDANSAYELTEQIQHPHAQQWVGRAKTLIEVDLGLVDEARASAEVTLARGRANSYDVYVAITLGVLGRLELALGHLDEAGRYLREIPARLLDGAVLDPTVPVWADAIETLVALGEIERATDYLTVYQQSADRLGSPWAVAAAARSRGLVAGARGDADTAFAAFDSALAVARERSFPLESARTLLSLGTVRRQAQQKKAAREALEQALAIFEELGARLWAEKARSELKRISGRAPASEGLTETERRVAELAAHGRTNKEIAAELFMGLSTVESHLSHVYRKLGLRRAELAAGLQKVEVDA